jgi:hypothetical protein
MAFGPPQYTPPGLEQILAQLDNAAVMERARNMGLGGLPGMGAAGPANIGSIPMNAGYGGGATNMPYGYGSLETPTTDALMEAMRRRGPYAGGRGFLKGTGAPLGLPRASLATELQAGMYGAGGSTIGQNVIPMGNPSSIPPGAGRGAGAANMPYAQWQQASDDLVNSVARQGPYAGTRGWGRSSGPAYMAETGFPRQLALPQQAESLRIPNQTGLAGAVNEVPVARPGSIPAGAGRGAGATAMPYADEAIALGPVRQAPVRQSTLRNALRNGTQSGSGMSINNAGALAESVIPETPVSISGRRVPDWRSFQGGSNGVGAAGFPTADYVATAAPEVAATGGLRGMLGSATGGVRGAATSAFSPKNGASNMGNIKRFGLGLGIGMGGGAIADRLGGAETVPGQFTEGFAQGGSFGAVGGLPGALVGGLGVGIGNTLSHAIQGRGIESILGGGEGEIADTPLGNYIMSQQVTGEDGSQNLTDQGAIVAALVGESDVNIFPQLGIDSQTEATMKQEINSRLAATDSQEERVNILKDAADELLGLVTGEGQTGADAMNPQDIAAMQIMASQMMAPVAADSVALGNMQASALEGLQGTLPEAYRQPVQQMVDQAVPRGQRVANAYMQQAYAMSQLDVLQGYQNQVDQTAQQLTAQALSGAYGTGATGGGDLASLIAGAAGGGGSSADIVAALAGG